MKTTGIDDVESLLDPSRLKRALSEPLAFAVDSLLRVYRKAPPPKGSYRRSGRLTGSWNVDVLSGATGVELSNPRNYGSFVYGDDQGDDQAWMHVGRWVVARQEADRIVPQIVARAEDQINAALGG